MKKIILLVGALAGVLSASAELQFEQLNTGVPKRMVVQKATESSFTTRASEDMLVFGYCTGINSALGLQDAVLEAAIEIPEELAQKWKGAKVEGIRIGFGTSTNHKVLYYITKELDGYPITYPPIPSGTIAQEKAWNEFMFPEPYTIDGTPFYVGYQSSCGDSGRDFPIGIDLNTSNFSEYGDLASIDNDWGNIGEDFGNVCVKVLISGDMLPINEATVSDIYVPSLVQKDTPFEGGFLVTNNGVAPIENVDYTLSINGKVVKSGTYDFDGPIDSGAFQWARFSDLTCDAIGNPVPVVVTITKVNGVADDTSDNTLSAATLCTNVVYPQNVLVEEFTGTWCQWCPRGMVGMAYMEENYGDDGFIGVAVHSGDAMQSTSYILVANKFTNNYPMAIANRAYTFDPSSVTLEEYFKQLSASPSPFNVEIVSAEYVLEENAVYVNVATQVAIDFENVNFQLAVALAENNVGPYNQSNAFSGGRPGTDYYLEGWTTLPNPVSTMYNEVGRVIVDPFGIMNSVPSNLKEGETYEYTVKIPANTRWNLNNSYVVAMLLNVDDGEVLNSAKLDEIANANAGVDGILDEQAKSYKVYNTQGVKLLDTEDASALQSLPKGIYIINGKKVMK